MSGITIKKRGCLQGKEIVLFRLQNESGSYVEILNYGATLTSIVVPDLPGTFANVALDYPTVEDYFSDTSYLGSTVGRFANRIAQARFELDGKTYRLDRNDGPNTNHGGFNGFNKKVFDYEICEKGVVFYLNSEDGEGGFPGNLQFSVYYSFSETNELTIEYKAVSDKKTVFNPTNHAYFNLSARKESILGHELKIAADQYLESTHAFLPTGKIIEVQDSAFDFRDFKNIGQMALLKREILKGYNTYFIHPENNNKELKKLASLKESESGRRMDIYSTMPGVQIYTGDYLGGYHQPFEGICLEAQFYPDTPNHEKFPSCIIESGQEFHQVIIYRFYTSH